MSYIDQDALLERIDGIYDCNDMRFEPNDKCCTVPDDCKGCKWAETKRAIRKIVENMPTADVRPAAPCFNASGTPSLFRCSACGWECSDTYYCDSEFEFCPHCGRFVTGMNDGRKSENMSERRFLTVDEAVSLLPNTAEVHTQIQSGMMFIGADWSREEIVEKIKNSEFREITGPRARAIGHGLALYDKDTKWQSDILFVETDKAKLDEFDPVEEQT